MLLTTRGLHLPLPYARLLSLQLLAAHVLSGTAAVPIRVVGSQAAQS